MAKKLPCFIILYQTEMGPSKNLKMAQPYRQVQKGKLGNIEVSVASFHAINNHMAKPPWCSGSKEQVGWIADLEPRRHTTCTMQKYMYAMHLLRKDRHS